VNDDIIRDGMAASARWDARKRANGNGYDPYLDVPPISDEPPDDRQQAERSWCPIDLAPVLSGTWKPAQPTVGSRTDGVHIFYPAKVHTVASESEAGKTWLVLAAAFDELRAGNTVLYIDFEDDEASIVGRLLTLQAPHDWIRDQFCYLRPTESVNTTTNLADLSDILVAYRPTLAVIDGVTEAMTMHGLDPVSNRDVAIFGSMLPRRLAAAGCATVCLDHVVKDADSRGRYALGGVHKLNGLDGAALILESHDPFGIGLTGSSTILISKDRPGQLRRHADRRKDGLYMFGELVLTSHDDSYAEFEIRPPGPARTEFMPTRLMTKISDALQQHGPMSQRAILATVGGKRQYAADALALLQRDGYVSNKTPHELLKPFTDDETDGD
jgi:hypothetical protein